MIEIVFEDTDFEFYAAKIRQYIDEAKYNSMEYISRKQEAIDDGSFKDLIDKNFIKDFL